MNSNHNRKLEDWQMLDFNPPLFIGRLGRDYIVTAEFVDIDPNKKILFTKHGEWELGEPNLVFIKKYL